MCLSLRENYRTPYNGKKIRWKVVVDYHNHFRGPYQLMPYNSAGQWNVAFEEVDWPDSPWDYCNFGFHVYYTRQEARNHIKTKWWSDELRVVKVEVDEFLASGTFLERRSETWRKMKILKK